MWWIIAILVLAILAVITIIFLRLTTLITYLSQQKDPIIIDRKEIHHQTQPSYMVDQAHDSQAGGYNRGNMPTYRGSGMQHILVEG